MHLITNPILHFVVVLSSVCLDYGFCVTECPELDLPNFYTSNCNATNREHTCYISCEEGRDFMEPISNTIHCGPATAYQWSFELNGPSSKTNFPKCTKTRAPEQEEVTIYLSSPDISCEEIIITSNILKYIGDHNDTVPFNLKISRECSSSTTNTAGRKKRGVGAVAVMALKFVFGSLVEVGMNYLFDWIEDGAKSGDLTLDVAGGESHNAVVDKSSKHLCEHGMVPKGDKCFECPVGSYHNEESCILCDFGSYQDEEGMEECKTCPSGYTTDNVGSEFSASCNETDTCPLSGECQQLEEKYDRALLVIKILGPILGGIIILAIGFGICIVGRKL